MIGVFGKNRCPVMHPGGGLEQFAAGSDFCPVSGCLLLPSRREKVQLPAEGKDLPGRTNESPGYPEKGTADPLKTALKKKEYYACSAAGAFETGNSRMMIRVGDGSLWLPERSASFALSRNCGVV